MKRFIFIIHCSFFILHCSLSSAATLKVCMKNTYLNCESRVGKFLAVTGSLGSRGYSASSGTVDTSHRTWQWSPWTYLASGNYSIYDGLISVEGIHMCSATSGTFGQTGNPGSYSGSYCWCKMTKLDGNSCPGASWVYQGDSDASYSATVCAGDIYQNCAKKCVEDVQGNATFRAAVLALP